MRVLLNALLDTIYAVDIPTDEKRSITDLMLRISEHEEMEQRFGTLLTIADVAFIKNVEAKHLNVTLRETILCLCS